MTASTIVAIVLAMTAIVLPTVGVWVLQRSMPTPPMPGVVLKRVYQKRGPQAYYVVITADTSRVQEAFRRLATSADRAADAMRRFHETHGDEQP